MKAKKLLSIFLALALVLGLAPAISVPAHAAGTNKAIQLVEGGSAANISGAQASNVYFGNYKQTSDGGSGYNVDPIKWRVLENANSQLFLLADQNLDVFRYHNDYVSVTWETSHMRSWLNGGTGYSSDSFIGNAFAAKEQSAIAETTVQNKKTDDYTPNPDYDTSGGNDTMDKIFPLSITDAMNTEYGFTGDKNSTASRVATNTAYVAGGGKIGSTGMYGVGVADYWWLRSPGDRDGDAAYVNNDGFVGTDGGSVDSDLAVRPAFKINLNSVLFTSAAVGGKPSGGLTEIGEYAGNEWKLTLLDSSRSGFSVTTTSVSTTNYGGDIQIEYSGAKTGDNEYIAVLLKDSAGNPTYYGRSAALTEANGTVTIPVAAGLTAGDATLYVYNEQYNGDKMTDLASELKSISLTVRAANTYTVSFAANGGTGSMADATGVSSEYTLPANGFTAPAGKQFKAWSVGGVEKAVGDKITVTADTTVTAVWETIPAGHTCDIKPVAKVKPTCTEGGKEAYYKCEGCGKFYEDALGTKEITDLASWGNLAKLGHTESDWKSDKDNHWKECTVAGCGVIIENSKAAHADANNDGKCDICEYNVGKTSTNPGNKPSDDVQNPQTGDNSLMWLWVALLFVSGFGVVATTVYGKRRTARK